MKTNITQDHFIWQKITKVLVVQDSGTGHVLRHDQGPDGGQDGVTWRTNLDQILFLLDTQIPPITK